MTTKELRRILFAEDDPDIQVVARMALETIGGYTVQLCASGKEALEIAESFAPDLVILDVMMPGMGGPATLATLRQHATLSSIPVVFMTAKVQPHEVAEYKRLGALGVIAKPFDPMALPDQIRDLWVGREPEREG